MLVLAEEKARRHPRKHRRRLLCANMARRTRGGRVGDPSYLVFSAIGGSAWRRLPYVAELTLMGFGADGIEEIGMVPPEENGAARLNGDSRHPLGRAACISHFSGPAAPTTGQKLHPG